MADITKRAGFKQCCRIVEHEHSCWLREFNPLRIRLNFPKQLSLSANFLPQAQAPLLQVTSVNSCINTSFTFKYSNTTLLFSKTAEIVGYLWLEKTTLVLERF